MPEVREVFEMATQKVRPEPGALERQHRGQRRRSAQRKAGVYVLVVVLGIVAAVLVVRAIPEGTHERKPAAPLERPTDGVAIVDLQGAIVGTIGADASDEAERLLRGTSYGVSLSPDGTKVAISDGTSIYTMNADGTGLTELTRGDLPTWSPDGSVIAFAGNERGIQVISPDGTGSRTVVPVVRFIGGPTPAWSPDGQRIAYNDRRREMGGPGEGIWVVDADGGRPTRLTRGPDASPSWHPDGTTIVFTRGGRTEDLFAVAADDGARPTPLAATDGGEDRGLWSPSGDLLAYGMSSGLGGWEWDLSNVDVHVLDMRTGEDRVVLEGAAPIGWASEQTLVVEL